MKNTNIALFSAFVLAVSAAGAMAQTGAAPGSGAAPAPAAPACVAEKLSSDSTVAELLDNPAAKAILIKHVPALKDNDQIDQARPMTLRALQTYAPDTFTDKVYADIDADLATLPVCAKK